MIGRLPIGHDFVIICRPYGAKKHSSTRERTSRQIHGSIEILEALDVYGYATISTLRVRWRSHNFVTRLMAHDEATTNECCVLDAEVKSRRRTRERFHGDDGGKV